MKMPSNKQEQLANLFNGCMDKCLKGLKNNGCEYCLHPAEMSEIFLDERAYMHVFSNGVSEGLCTVICGIRILVVASA